MCQGPLRTITSIQHVRSVNKDSHRWMSHVEDGAPRLPSLVQVSHVYAISRISATLSGPRQALKCNPVVAIGAGRHGVGRDNSPGPCSQQPSDST